MASKLNQKLKEINKSLQDNSALTQQELKYYREQLKSIKEQNKSLEAANILHNNILQAADNLGSSFDSINSILRDNNNQLSGGNDSLNQALSASRKIANISNKILSIKRGESNLSDKQLDKLRTEIKEKIRVMQASLKTLSIDDERREIIKENIKLSKKEAEGIKKLQGNIEKVNKQLGAGPRIFAGLDKTLSKLGLPTLGINEALQQTYKDQQKASSEDNKNFSIKVAFSKNLASNLNKALSLSTLMQGAFTFMVKSFMDIDKHATSLARSMNITQGMAVAVQGRFRQIAIDSGDIMIDSKGLGESLMAINSTLGTNAHINDETLKTMTEMREKAGFTNDELMGAVKLHITNGKTLKQNLNTITKTAFALNKQHNTQINEREVLKEISKVSDAVTLSFGKNPGLLAEAVHTAKRLGFEMSQLEGIADGLLDFERSIDAEMQAEILSGKDLNLERARGFALMNETGKMAEALAGEIEKFGSFSEMNRIEQQGVAAAMMMSRDELAKTMFMREQISSLGKEDARIRQEVLNKRIQQVGLEQATKEAQDGTIDKMTEQFGIAERFEKIITRIQEIFVNMADGPLGRVAEIIAKMLENTTLMKLVVGTIATIYSTKLLTGLVQSLGKALLLLGAQESTAIAAMTTASATSGGLAIPLIIAGATAGAAAMYALTADDMMSEPGYGKRTLLGPEGAIQLNDKDTVIAGTDLFPKSSGAGTGGGISPSSDVSAMGSKLDTMIALLEKGSTIEMDGFKLGEAVNQGARAI